MSDFGDWEPADSFDTAPPDPEQVARRIAAYDGHHWDELDDEERGRRLAAVLLLIAWGRRQGWIR